MNFRRLFSHSVYNQTQTPASVSQTLSTQSLDTLSDLPLVTHTHTHTHTLSLSLWLPSVPDAFWRRLDYSLACPRACPFYEDTHAPRRTRVPLARISTRFSSRLALRRVPRRQSSRVTSPLSRLDSRVRPPFDELKLSEQLLLTQQMAIVN